MLRHALNPGAFGRRKAQERGVFVSPQQSVVRPLSVTATEDAVDLQDYGVQRLAGCLTSEQTAALTSHIEARVEAPNVDRAMHSSLAFYLVLSVFTGNGEFWRVTERQRDLLRRVKRQPHSGPDDRKRSSKMPSGTLISGTCSSAVTAPGRQRNKGATPIMCGASYELVSLRPEFTPAS